MDTATDPQRPDVHNGLLLSTLWDAAFDRGLISFADDGTVLASSHAQRGPNAELMLPFTSDKIGKPSLFWRTDFRPLAAVCGEIA